MEIEETDTSEVSPNQCSPDNETHQYHESDTLQAYKHHKHEVLHKASNDKHTDEYKKNKIRQ